MKHRDIDFHIYSSSVSLADDFRIMAKLAENPAIRKIEYTNLLNTDEACLEWHAWYEDEEHELWQIVVVRHYDKAHPHCHIVFSRVDYDGKILAQTTNFKKNERVCKALNLKYRLMQGKSKLNTDVSKLRGKEKVRCQGLEFLSKRTPGAWYNRQGVTRKVRKDESVLLQRPARVLV